MTLAVITFFEAQFFFKAHNKVQDTDSLTLDLEDFYEDDTIEIRRCTLPDRIEFMLKDSIILIKTC